MMTGAPSLTHSDGRYLVSCYAYCKQLQVHPLQDRVSTEIQLKSIQTRPFYFQNKGALSLWGFADTYRSILGHKVTTSLEALTAPSNAKSVKEMEI